jgi:site-specific recombinase XerD
MRHEQLADRSRHQARIRAGKHKGISMSSATDNIRDGRPVRRGRNGQRLSRAAVKGFGAGKGSANAGRRFPAEILTQDEVRALINACSKRAPTGIRNRALLVMMYRGGLRVSEALALFPKDIDPEQGTVAILHGKGDKQRTIALDPGAFAVIEKWVERRERLGFRGRHPLFCTLEGRQMYSSYVRRLLPRLAKKAGIEKRVHPHGLRHTHAYELAVLEGIPVPIVQAALGHSSLATTDRYLRHIAPAKVIETMRAREWTL